MKEKLSFNQELNLWSRGQTEETIINYHEEFEHAQSE